MTFRVQDSSTDVERAPASHQSNGAIPNGNPVMNGRASHGELPNGIPNGTCKESPPEDKAAFTETSFITEDNSPLILPEESKPAPKQEPVNWQSFSLVFMYLAHVE